MIDESKDQLSWCRKRSLAFGDERKLRMEPTLKEDARRGMLGSRANKIDLCRAMSRAEGPDRFYSSFI
jgi:hypothetical protein